MFSRVMFSLTAASICLLGYALWRGLDAEIATYVVRGDLTPAEGQQVQRVLAESPPQRILSGSLPEVAARVMQLPWARDVSVRRAWPDRLVVTLHKAQPVARWGDDYYVANDGTLLALPDQYPGLARFDVALSEPAHAMQVYRLLDQMSSRHDLVIERLAQNDRGEWQVSFRDGLDVLLGSEQISNRMGRFLSAYRQAVSKDLRRAQYVDARYSNGVAVRYDESGGTTLLAGNPAEIASDGEIQ